MSYTVCRDIGGRGGRRDSGSRIIFWICCLVRRGRNVGGRFLRFEFRRLGRFFYAGCIRGIY